MKTYCKRKDVSDVAFVKESISEFLLDRLDKSNVAKLFAYYNGISNTKSRKRINDSKEFVEDTIKCIAADISKNIRNRTVVDHILLVTPNEPLVKYVEIVDGLSGKKRELGIEKLIFQLYETIIRDATKEMFEAKIGEYQVASIKGRGQSYGKKHIKRWISSDPEGTKYCGKADVQKCYPSMPHDKLKALLHRDLRKSDMLLYLFDTIIYLYDYANELLGRNDCLGKGILIGSPVSKDLCNYYMSYLYHYINEKLFEKTVRRGKEKLTRLVSHVMIYMDDIVVFGGNKKHMHKAMEMIVAFTRDFLGLVIKPTWQKFLVSYKTNQGKTKGRNLDFMGFGKDGRVCLIVDEANRSWCSSSNANDQRAVTIECASDMSEPYSMTNAVYEKLIQLCIDICKRNGKTKLIWFADKNKSLNYSPKSNEMVLTVHRWFANKSCPGDWLYSRLGDVANRVTAQLNGSSGGGTTGGGNTSGGSGNYKTGMYKVNVGDLNIRKGPGTNYDINGVITDKGTYTITEIQNGSWGKLKSGAGWINVDKDYCAYRGASSSGGNTAESSGSFQVQVSISDLYIRKGPGTNYGNNGFCPKGVYTIVETKSAGGYTWGRLKSGAGWIALEHTKRL